MGRGGPKRASGGQKRPAKASGWKAVHCAWCLREANLPAPVCSICAGRLRRLVKAANRAVNNGLPSDVNLALIEALNDVGDLKMD